jgi:hypothetical protein
VKAKEAGRCWWAVGGAASAAGGGSCFAGEANGLQQQQAFRDIFIGGSSLYAGVLELGRKVGGCGPPGGDLAGIASWT